LVLALTSRTPPGHHGWLKKKKKKNALYYTVHYSDDI